MWISLAVFWLILGYTIVESNTGPYFLRTPMHHQFDPHH